MNDRFRLAKFGGTAVAALFLVPARVGTTSTGLFVFYIVMIFVGLGIAAFGARGEKKAKAVRYRAAAEARRRLR